MNNFDFDNELERRSDKIEEQLLNFSRNGNYKQVVHLFDKFYDNPGFDVNCRDVDGNTPLILAAKQGHGSIIQELLRYTPDISCENKKGDTAMYLSPTAIRKILFGSISSVIKCSDRLFCNACWLSNVEVVDRFLGKNQVSMGPHLANTDGVNCFQLVLKNMSHLEQVASSIKSAYKPAQTLQSLLTHALPALHDPRLLHVAANKNCKSAVECARVLLKKNFEIGGTDELDFTAIHCAARSGNAGVLELLLRRLESREDKSKLIDFQGKSGTSALHLAAMEGKEEAVRLLLSHGASAELVNSQKYSPAQLAKSVRIKNLFNAQSPASKDKSFPDVHFVLTRANTAVPHSPQTKFSPHDGKKSAEPIYRAPREKSLSSPDVNNQFDIYASAAFPPLLSIKPLIMSTELPIISHANSSFRPKLVTTRSVVSALECLDEENYQELLIYRTTDDGENPDEEIDVFNSRKSSNEFVAPIFQKIRLQKQTSTPSKGDQVGNVADSTETECQSMRPEEIAGTANHNKKEEPTRNAAGPMKKRTNPSKIRTVSKPVKNGKKPELGNREKTKSTMLTNDKRKVNRRGQNCCVKTKENTTENEAIYESDFNTDSSSAREETETNNNNNNYAINLEEREEKEDEEDDLNKTLIESLSARMTKEHIQWKKGEQLGKGSYGTVWKGMLENGQYIAVKEILIPDEEDNLESCLKSTREIRREIEILQTIQHKNIVKYIGACDSVTCIHIFMEFVSGGSIFHILTKFGGLSEKIIKIYMKQLVTAVAFLHTKLIIHRDLKGANIMVTPKGVIKVADFGCAKKLENFTSGTGSLTQQSRLQGSVYWLAPEVINGAKHTHKSDIWSIGCTGIEMVTTKPPWSDSHPYAAMFAIGTGNKPINISQLITSNGAKISSEICLFIESCLTRDVTSRVTAIDLLNSPFLN